MPAWRLGSGCMHTMYVLSGRMSTKTRKRPFPSPGQIGWCWFLALALLGLGRSPRLLGLRCGIGVGSSARALCTMTIDIDSCFFKDRVSDSDTTQTKPFLSCASSSMPCWQPLSDVAASTTAPRQSQLSPPTPSLVTQKAIRPIKAMSACTRAKT